MVAAGGPSVEHLLVGVDLASSGSDAARKLQQGAVRIDGEKFTATRARRPGSPFVLQVGDVPHRARPVMSTVSTLRRGLAIEPGSVATGSVRRIAADGGRLFAHESGRGQVSEDCDLFERDR